VEVPIPKPKCAFVVVDIVVVALQVLAGEGGDLGEVSIVIGQETGPVEVYSQIKRAVEPLDEHALNAGRLVVIFLVCCSMCC